MGKVINFADDTSILYSANNNTSLKAKIEREFLKVTEWLACNKLSLNIKKTKLLLFQKKRNVDNILKLLINNEIIESSESTTFLGVEISNNLNWQNHIDKICNKISQIIYTMKRIKNHVPGEILKIIYTSLILPQINYGLLSWFNPLVNNIKRLETLQKKAVRTILNTKYNAHTDPLLIQLNLLKLKDAYNLKGIKLYWNIVHNKTPLCIANAVTTNRSHHNYQTRQANQIHIYNMTSQIEKQSLRYKLYNIMQQLPNYDLETITQTSLKQKIKTHYIEQYSNCCNLKHCYTCNK